MLIMVPPQYWCPLNAGTPSVLLLLQCCCSNFLQKLKSTTLAVVIDYPKELQQSPIKWDEIQSSQISHSMPSRITVVILFVSIPAGSLFEEEAGMLPDQTTRGVGVKFWRSLVLTSPFPCVFLREYPFNTKQKYIAISYAWSREILTRVLHTKLMGRMDSLRRTFMA